MTKPSKSSLSRLILHGYHSYFVPNYYISNPIQFRLATHPMEHPYLRNHHPPTIPTTTPSEDPAYARSREIHM